MAEWIDLAQEVISVDSNSTDGTQKILQQGLSHPKVRWLDHPPGLYASWNAGIQALGTDYVYISTIGDTITRPGIQKLLQAATEMDADVTISKPLFKKPNGDMVQVDWPIDDMVRSLDIRRPRALHRLEAVVFATAHAWAALTGSCASDLFRTTVLKRSPFPTEFGTGGDGIWSVRHAAEVTWAIVPGNFSTFLLHPTGASQAENPTRSDAAQPDAVLREAMDRWLKADLLGADDIARIRWRDLRRTLGSYLLAKAAFDRSRKAHWPWILNPTAWSARIRREHSADELQRLKQFALRTVAEMEGH
jgi:glycosyltransferase involved in cell wall biosynthesis